MSSNEKEIKPTFGVVSSGTGSGSASVPTGAILPYGGAGAPSGYQLCDGSAISRTTFATLFAVIGTQYGIGDGATTFNLPDFRTNNSFPRGATNDAGRGTTGGSAAVTLSAAQSGVPAHTHQNAGGQSTGSADACQVRPNNEATTVNGTEANSAAGASASHENQPPFVDVNYIIKE